ncbi:MAG: prolipoprotein diacylglyceryl transferase [Anaerolineaceae bacterium]|jgi:phosphatidylglycerol:prolipoprotein diacylglycerol transferase|nr:prolipoprotein diacylglyceryl transferase [Anaerolineae bacterium]MBV6467244.1 Prolipoprotein diacylglyceryl transferase [Anaerolineales bacterium]MCE7906056.1 prolipoprotein diacylglyceryl transferase [Anaerolineae bacterium CFX3]MDL1925734.1 prolipoprotein diacylglyceryl transferase [Anaerolineae bacterium AMX1]OQY86028.1 MAG: prolipoprotein diacylglyceryl transferase [Anaerolineae bacterium UTCFX3]GER80277.1 prolipoprotein diacylglyceryl transferase [Candidatus Denitrolinea symbiosum]GI
MIRFLFDGIYIYPANGDPWRLLAWYGVILMSGAMAGAWLAAREVKRRGGDPEVVWDLLVYLIIGGVIGARLWHVFTPPPSSIEQGITTSYYLTHPIDLVNLRKGGLGIPGAVIGGMIALYYYTRKYKMNFAEWTDIAAPSVALGQAIGRFGNYFNQEVYGAPTDLPWKIYIEPAYRVSGFKQYDYFHPLFLYEALWNLANMFLLIWLSRRFADQLKPGDVFLAYLIVYPVGRFLLDFLRLDAAQLGGINANQTFMAIVALIAATALFIRHRPRKE